MPLDISVITLTPRPLQGVLVWKTSSQDSFLFTGTNATAAYHQLGFTGNLPLHSEGNDASDLYHYGNDDPLDLYLMDNAANFGVIKTTSSLDTAILQDLGYLIG